MKKIKSTDLEILLNEFIRVTKISWQYLLSKWAIILIFGLGGGSIGLVVALMNKPEYKSHLSFALIESSGGSSGLAALASSFGFGGLGSSDDAFSGDNLLEIIKSRHAVEQTLLTPVEYKGKKETLAEVYIQFNKLRKNWENSKIKELHGLHFPIGQKRETFSRAQDSVLFSIYNGILESGALSVAKKDKMTGIVNVDFASGDELFSKYFVEKLMSETYQFYKETRTAQSRANIDMMQATADSIKHLYEAALYSGASYSVANLNIAVQTAAVPRIKQQNNATVYAEVYAEVLKNLETLKLDLARQTPLVQIIDTPILPLEVDKMGKTKSVILGGLIGGIFIVIYLLGSLYFKGTLSKSAEE